MAECKVTIKIDIYNGTDREVEVDYRVIKGIEPGNIEYLNVEYQVLGSYKGIYAKIPSKGTLTIYATIYPLTVGQKYTITICPQVKEGVMPKCVRYSFTPELEIPEIRVDNVSLSLSDEGW